MKSKSKIYGFAAMAAAILTLSGCDFNTNNAGRIQNGFIIGLSVTAGAVLLFFISYAIITNFYKGKTVEVKVLKKLETKVLRGNTIGRGTPGSGGGRSDLSRRARRQKTRLRYNKVIVELEGKEKKLRCNDLVILDKLVVGKMNKMRIRFGEIIKVLK
jgi:outer membrane lipopolysaccharide assembly protein LptE/RlpB